MNVFLYVSSAAADEITAVTDLASKAIPVLARFLVSGILAIVCFLIGSKFIGWGTDILARAMKKRGVEVTTGEYVVSGVRILGRTLLILVILGQLGLQQGTIVAAIGSLGIGIGLALQGAATNLAGGILILIQKPFKVGDFIVEVSEGNEGFVKEISLLYTTLVSLGGRTITIPNQKLTDAAVINMTAAGVWILDITVGIGYGDDLAKAKEIMLNVLTEDPAVIQDMEIMCAVTALSEHSVDLTARAYTSVADHFTADWRVRENIKLAFDAAGITIAFNQLDVHLDAPVAGLTSAGK